MNWHLTFVKPVYFGALQAVRKFFNFRSISERMRQFVVFIDVVSGTARWKKGGEGDVRFAAESFRVTRARPTQLEPGNSNDYRSAGSRALGRSQLLFSR